MSYPTYENLGTVVSTEEKLISTQKLLPNLFWPRMTAIIENVWYLTPEERELLDTHVALRTTSYDIETRIYEDEKDHYKEKLKIGVITYTIHYVSFSREDRLVLEETEKSVDLVVSLRVINSKGIAICLIQPKWDALTEEKFLNYKELVF